MELDCSITTSMPLVEMSPNISESEAISRKRSHDEISEDDKMEVDGETKSLSVVTIKPDESLLPPTTDSIKLSRGSPAHKNTPALNSPSPLTPIKNEAVKPSASAQTPTSSATTNQGTPSSANPPAKRKRLTPAEKEARDKELADKKKERDEQLAVKAAEKAKAEAEKAAKAKEREEQLAVKAAEKAKAEVEKAAKAKEREEQQAIKAVEKAKAQEEKAAKAKEREEKRKKKEEEQRRIQEEKDRKAKSQQSLNSFFTPKKSANKPVKDESRKVDSPVKAVAPPQQSQYDKMFRPFFVKENTKLAPIRPEMDDETRDAKSQILDQAIRGEREAEASKGSFDVVRLFALPCKPPRRGRRHHPVRHIMEQLGKDTVKAKDAEEEGRALAEARRKLAKVPMKVIAFSQDVRPPYSGTCTFEPYFIGLPNLSQIARTPTARCLKLDYDYDSEAEWQEEEGEDLDMEDDEEELDEEDDMEGFLDDSEDSGLSRRIFANAMEPESTGICFEDADRQGPNYSIYENKMEFMHGRLEQTHGIDPWSTEYWEPEPKSKTAKAATDAGTKMAPPPAPANAFAAMTASAAAPEALKLVKSEIMNDVKKAILDNSELSKVGIVEVIFNQFRDRASRVQVQNTLGLVAVRQGAGRKKSWTLKPGHEIAL